jgi:hypothetical protein
MCNVGIFSVLWIDSEKVGVDCFHILALRLAEHHFERFEASSVSLKGIELYMYDE